MRGLARSLSSDPDSAARAPRLWPALLLPVTGNRLVLAGTVVAIVALGAAGYGLVLFGGGTKYAGTFALLLPVLLAATVFLIPGGVIVGVLAGLVLGPLMPLDVEAGIPQPTANWLIRLGWFVGLGGFVGVLTAVPRWRRLTQDHRVLFDALSGLPTPDAVRVAARGTEVAFALAVDFGMYERLLDIHSRQVAGEFVRAVSGCLRNAVRDPDADPPLRLTRVRSDVFGLLLPGDPGLLSVTIDAVLQRMPRWVTLDGDPTENADPLIVPVTAHVGIAEVTAADLGDFDTFRNSIRAARAARETGRPVARYDRASAPVARENVQMAAELLQAIERGELYLVYQPKQRLADGKVTAAEALLRWQSPRRGLVPPSRFIPVAEQSSLINTLTDWVLQHAGETMRGWQAEGRDLRLSVNLSGRDLTDERMLDRLRGLPAQAGVEAGAFSLEITETAFIGDLGPIVDSVQALSVAGYDILVDDFGTGCSSFAYLHRLPVDGAKIDRAFVASVTTDPTAAELVNSMLEWCRRIGKRTIAEGVEDAATAEALREMGCDEIQGYWISRPLSTGELGDWLARRGPGPARDG